MWNKILDWFYRYEFQIHWFLTGWFTSQFFTDFSNGNWLGAFIDAIIIVANIAYFKK